SSATPERDRCTLRAMEIRAITDDEATQFREAMLQTFGLDAADDAGSDLRMRHLIAPGQAWAVFDGGSIVGTAGTFNFDIGIPGGSLPIAGLTMVTVRPTHRRRGLLRSLMTRHLDDARARGLGVSGLWASEATIYGRFGYGIAAEHDEIEIRAADQLVFRSRDVDEVGWIDESRAREVLPAIYARATSGRPGAVRRPDVWWRERRFLETSFHRDGASTRRHVLARRGDELVGYVAYRHRLQGGLGGKTEIIELHGIDPRAEATLWRYVLQMDLFRDVSWSNAPVDGPLPFLVDNFRRIERRRSDNVWLRIEDVATALRARRYQADGALRFAIEGQCFELVVRDGEATCGETTQSSDVEITRAALGSLYLGGFTASRLARAGHIRGDARAITLADQLFGWSVSPWCPEIF
ncbi:MAG TPA: GNAT family N-acetyltransferase, partial [Kofleriaceae bacterium]|nr:GNAT family N-acetyltransferase [Kofleriaceae bacterium]